MEDLTEDLLLHGEQFVYTEDPPDNLSVECPSITVEMLNQNPSIKAEIFEALKEYLVNYADAHLVTSDTIIAKKETIDAFTDEQWVNALNSDPYIQGTIFECLNHVTDCLDSEGPAIYYPSILNMDNLHDLNQVSCFREEQVIDDLPAKYAHLDQIFIERIYGCPELRQVVAEMDAGDITPAFIIGYKNTCSP